MGVGGVRRKSPCILNRGEATSALDSVNEAAIQAALIPLMEGRTSLVIAHRLSTILNADVVFVVEAARIVEHGTPDELLPGDGAKARPYWSQFRDATVE